ncbi:unnamed protein product [Pedinophyceae sp. YPF-701]|nr:unnamed protein product [Pedinophyceae sp. YPF-701]
MMPGDARTSEQAAAPAGHVNREPMSLQLQVEELRGLLSTHQEVNAHLNKEVERLTVALEERDEEIFAYARHVRDLAERLVDARSGAPARPREDTLQELLQPPPKDSRRGPDPAADAARDEVLVICRSSLEAAGLLLDQADVTLGDVIGRGAFGVTYRGRWRGAAVAVKCVEVPGRSEAMNLARELSALMHGRHPCILPMYGAVVSPPASFWMVTELMEGGTVREWLYGKGGGAPGSAAPPKRALGDRVAVACDIASGIAHLHSLDPPMMHRDVKPSNAFVDARGRACLADMGLARRVARDGEPLTGETGTYVYMAPEVWRHEPYSQAVDVFSFGVLLAELATQTPPYSGMYLSPVQIATSVADGGARPQPPDALPRASALCKACWASDPAARPSMDEVAREMPEVLREARKVEAEEAARARGTLVGRVANLASSAWAGALGR